MSKLQQVEQVVLTMTPEEQEDLRDWLETFLEDRLEMTNEFKAGKSENHPIASLNLSLNDNATLIAETWDKLGPPPEINYDKL